MRTLNQGSPLLLDGGMGQELAARGLDTRDGLWSARALLDQPAAQERGSIRDAMDGLDGVDVDVVLVNCSMLSSIGAALRELAIHAACPFGAYANGSSAIDHHFDVQDGANIPAPRVDLTPDRYAEHVRRWLAAGATLVGGCCEVGPDHITRLRRLLGEVS